MENQDVVAVTVRGWSAVATRTAVIVIAGVVSAVYAHSTWSYVWAGLAAFGVLVSLFLGGPQRVYLDTARHVLMIDKFWLQETIECGELRALLVTQATYALPGLDGRGMRLSFGPISLTPETEEFRAALGREVGRYIDDDKTRAALFVLRGTSPSA